jgi:hypothetical protein
MGRITMGWDSRFNRLFFNQEDYIPLNDCVEYLEGKVLLNNTSCGDITSCPEGYTLDTISILV